MSKALSAASDSVKPPRMAIPPLLREMREEMQKEVDGDVARHRKSIKDTRKLAIRRVETASNAVLEKIEAMAEEAVAQASEAQH